MMRSVLLILLLFIGCVSASSANGDDSVVWIDVRSWLENQTYSIEGDAHIPHADIVGGVEALGLGKDAAIALYCQSGGRSGKALEQLTLAGYKNVINAGGINAVKQSRLGDTD